MILLILRVEVKSRKWSCSGVRRCIGKKVHEGDVKNPCYFAMDATRPHDLEDSKLGRQFYIFCELKETFRAIFGWAQRRSRLEGYRGFRKWKAVLDSKLTGGRALCDA